MPYIETIRTGEVSTTPAGIFEIMCDLNGCSDDKYRISFVYRTRSGAIVNIGDALQVPNGGGGLKKKRWWQEEKPADQLQLPFARYSPAQVVSATYSTFTRAMTVKVRCLGEQGHRYAVSLVHGGSCRGNVLAIKIHTIGRQWVEKEAQSQSPFFIDLNGLTPEAASQPSPTQSVTATNCIELLSRAVQNGLQITPARACYDARTGQRVGDNVQIVGPSPDGGTISVQLRGLNGHTYGVQVDQRMIQFVDDRRLTTAECGDLVTEATRVGMVVTSTGDGYNKETGELVGTDIRTERNHDEYADSPWRPYNIRGDLRVLNNELLSFQIPPDKLTYINEETYARPSRSQSQSALFAQMYGQAYSQEPGLRQNVAAMRANIQGPAAQVNRQAEDRTLRWGQWR